MENRLERSMNKLVGSALLAGEIAKKRKDEIKLVHCTGEYVHGLAMATDAASTDYIVARNLLSKLRADLAALRDEARVFTMLCCDILKPIYGRSYSERWDHTGFKGSLASPLKPEGLIVLADALRRFFAAHPELELPTRQITSASAKALSQRLTDAIYAVNDQAATTSELKQARDKKFTQLRKCMRNMIEELHILLDPLDPRWTGFGFNRPGAKQTPPAPEKVDVKVFDNRRAAITWPAPPRSEYYRVWMKVNGVDEEPSVIGTPSDTDFMFEELPPQSTLEIFVSAVNSGGESPLSAPVVIVTHYVQTGLPGLTD